LSSNHRFTDTEITALYDRNHRIIMDWSPKAGCTIATKMFFRHMGILDEALAYNKWVHEYRMNVFYKNHPVTIEDLINNNIYLFKIVRNPYQRVVSSYIHTMKYPAMHEIIKEKLWGWNADISFNKFVRFLEKIDIHNCDPHYRLQKKFFEYRDDLNYNLIVKLEDLAAGVDKVNVLAGVNFNLDGLTSGHHILKSDEVDKSVSSTKWSRIRDSIPSYEHFYTKELYERVFNIYKDDFLAYGYDPANA
jgi:hypothetical protein